MVVMVPPLSPLNQSGLLTNTRCQRDLSTGPRSGRHGDTNKNNTKRDPLSAECFHYAGQKQTRAEWKFCGGRHGADFERNLLDGDVGKMSIIKAANTEMIT